MNKKPEITSVHFILYLCNKISIRKPLVNMSHTKLFCFPFNVSFKQNTKVNVVFHVKSPV